MICRTCAEARCFITNGLVRNRQVNPRALEFLIISGKLFYKNLMLPKQRPRSQYFLAIARAPERIIKMEMQLFRHPTLIVGPWDIIIGYRQDYAPCNANQ